MRLLLVEDDADLCEAVRRHLEGAGFAVEICRDGTEGLLMAQTGIFDLLLLDRMLPGMDGVSLLKGLRASGSAVPVLFLTAMDGIGDRVDGLDAGADDYLTKPFAVEELLARVRALGRRSRVLDESERLRRGDLSLDMEQRTLSSVSGQVKLSRREVELLEAFLRSPGTPIPRERLLLRVWGVESDVEESSLDTYVHFLRRRLKSIGSRVSIVTLYGVGYQLEPGDEP